MSFETITMIFLATSRYLLIRELAIAVPHVTRFTRSRRCSFRGWHRVGRGRTSVTSPQSMVPSASNFSYRLERNGRRTNLDEELVDLIVQVVGNGGNSVLRGVLDENVRLGNWGCSNEGDTGKDSNDEWAQGICCEVRRACYRSILVSTRHSHVFI